MHKYFGSNGFFLLLIPFVLLGTAIVVFANNTDGTTAQTPTMVTGGDPVQGQQEMVLYGCGSCHEIAGIAGAKGKVGPPLAGIADRTFIAGRLPNNADNLVRWIQFPQSVSPGTDMPNLNVSESAARDMAAYLFTLR